MKSLTTPWSVSPPKVARPVGLVGCLRCAGLCLALVAWSSIAWSQTPTHPYRTANAIALASQLKAPFSQRVEKQSVLEAIPLWMAEYRVPIWIDRRIATDRELTLVLPSDATFRDALRALAEQLEAEMACLDRVVLIVPLGQSAAIEAGFWQACLAQPKASWMRSEAIAAEWEDGERASDLWIRFLEQRRVSIAGPKTYWNEVMDEDRWRKFRFENTTPLAVACTLLSGFELGVQPEATQLKSLALADITPQSVQWIYQDEISRLGKEAWSRWRQQWPDASVKNVAGSGPARWQILAPVAAHRELVEPLAPAPIPQKINDASKKRYTGRYRGELLRILQGFAQQSKLQLECPQLPAAVATMEIDIAFENITASEIADRFAKASGLKITLHPGVLRVEFE